MHYRLINRRSRAGVLKGAGALALGMALLFQVQSPLAAVTAYASGTCLPVAVPSSQTAPSGSFSTAADVIATFDHARQAEGCSVQLSIDQNAYNSATPQIQMLMLMNAERRDRGLPALQLDSTLLSQISLNHSREMAQYNYFAHPSPINQPGSTFNRFFVNPAINGHWSAVAENLAAGYGVATAMYDFMYQDTGDSWTHRQNILGYTGSGFGQYNWVGIGITSGNGTYGTYYTTDFLQGASWDPYSPPTAADTQAPTLSLPTIAQGSAGGTVTAQVTNVQDAGASSGEAGVTGVVFYVNSAVSAAVSASQNSSGIWTASLALPVGATLHAVAVDGSGNYRDCTAGSSSCGSSSSSTPTPTPTPSPTSTPAPTSSTLFSTSFDSGQPQPTWTNTMDSSIWNGGIMNATGICCGLSSPEIGVRQERSHTGSSALMYSGMDTSASQSFAYAKVLDLSSTGITIRPSTTLSYWIYPQSGRTSPVAVSGSNSTCVALDILFTDGSYLRDSGVVDQNGVRVHPAYQCGHLTLDAWNHVTAVLGTKLSGKTISRIDVGYDQPANTGGYRGYIDDITISN